MAAKPLSRRGQFTVGVLVAAMGLSVATLAASYVGKPGRVDPVVVFIAGLTLAFAGAVLVVPEKDGRMRAWFGAFMITSVALLLDWVALGLGGTREATAAVSVNASARSHFWQVPGQFMLLIGAMLFNLMALWAWFRARRVRRKARG
jgi:hypothetical protein